MKISIPLAAIASYSIAAAGASDFYDHWSDGKAELSSYRIVQTRYGEQRQAHGVLVFVTEDINRKTLIKVESAQPASDRLHVLKLNNVLKFKTGIYDYSVMTSAFSAVEGGEDSQSPFELQKLTFSSQEWCGHVYEEVRFSQGELHGDLSSYFEREGRQSYELATAAPFESEDHLLIRIRELKAPIMESGQVRRITLFPALWHFRTAHRARELVEASLAKGHGEEVDIMVEGRLASARAIPWTWQYDDRSKTVWVEEEYPHRILAWKESNGDSGELISTIRVPYWKLHGGTDEVYRDQLGLP